MDFAKQTISIYKELVRVTKGAIAKISKKGILSEFPNQTEAKKTYQIINRPKAKSSIRKVFVPRSLWINLKIIKIFKLKIGSKDITTMI